MCSFPLLPRATLLTLLSVVAATGARSQGATSAGETVRRLQQAENSFARHKWDSVITYVAPIADTTTASGRTWYLLGNAHYRTGDCNAAVPELRRAFDRGEGYPAAVSYTIAICYGRQAQSDSALEWIQRSAEAGLRNSDAARSNPAFASLRNDPRFIRLVGVQPRPGTSRGAGWSADLELLRTIVKRKAFHPFITRPRDRTLWPSRVDEREFDAVIESIRRAIPTLSDQGIGLEIARALTLLGVGHTAAPPTGEGRAAFPLSLPLVTYEFEEGPFIVAASPEWAALVGSRVTTIEDRPIAMVQDSVSHYISRDNFNWVRAIRPYYLRNSSFLHALRLTARDDTVRISVVDGRGASRTVRIAASRDDGDIWNDLPAPRGWITVQQQMGPRTPLYLRRMGENYWFEYLASANAMYVQYNRVVDNPKGESLAAFAIELDSAIRQAGAEKVIIDLRWNNGGDTFLNEPLLESLIRNPRLRRHGSVVVIVGRRTFSAAMNAAAYFERHLDAVFVGEPTGGSPNSIGDEVYESLPYSGLVFSIADVYWQSGWPYDSRPSIAPVIEVRPRFADFIAAKDPALEAALSITPLPR